MTTETQAQAIPFARQLASSDSRTRAQALDDLRTFLHSRTSLDETELLKIWKALFYALYMTDRPRPQAALSNTLAALPAQLPATLRWPFMRAFWCTLAREYGGLDAHRLDKFLHLCRLYVAAGLAPAFLEGGQRAGVAEEAASCFEMGPLTPGAGVPAGLRYHVLDVYVDELVRLAKPTAERSGGAAEGKSMDNLVLEVLMKPVRVIKELGETKTLRARAAEVLSDRRLQELSGFEGEPNNSNGQGKGDEDEDEWDGIEDD